MDQKYIAPYLIRAYVWELLQRNLGMSDEDYNADPNSTGGLVPIVPLGEEPEIKQFGKPYLVYGYSETPNPRAPERTNGNIIFMIYSDNFNKMSEVTNVIARAFDHEHTATYVNEFTSTIPAFHGIRFGHLTTSAVEGGTPEDEEGGNMSAMVNISYEYYSEYDLDLSFAIPVHDGNGNLTGYDKVV